MNPVRVLLVALCVSMVGSAAFCADDPKLAAVRAADDERCAAMVAGDRARMGAIFSDELRYSHSSGGVDTKASLGEAIASGKLKYVSFDYEARDFTFPAPGVALMTGRAKVTTRSEKGENPMTLAFLAVWREEGGKWRFLAWQSARMNPPAAVPGATPGK
jgi:hypothetical protein